MLRVEDVDDSMGNTLLALQRASEGTQASMRDAADAAVDAAWVPALAGAASTAQQRKLLVNGADATIQDLGFTLTAGNGPALSGGLDGSHWYAVDYGMTPKQILAPNRTRTIRGRRGGERKVRTRVWVGRNLPGRNKAGRVIFPTVTELAPYFVETWIDGLLGPLGDQGSPMALDDSDVKAQVGGSWQ